MREVEISTVLSSSDSGHFSILREGSDSGFSVAVGSEAKLIVSSSSKISILRSSSRLIRLKEY